MQTLGKCEGRRHLEQGSVMPANLNLQNTGQRRKRKTTRTRKGIAQDAQKEHWLESSSCPWGLTEYHGGANLAALWGARPLFRCPACFVAPRRSKDELARC